MTGIITEIDGFLSAQGEKMIRFLIFSMLASVALISVILAADPQAPIVPSQPTTMSFAEAQRILDAKAYARALAATQPTTMTQGQVDSLFAENKRLRDELVTAQAQIKQLTAVLLGGLPGDGSGNKACAHAPAATKLTSMTQGQIDSLIAENMRLRNELASEKAEIKQLTPTCGGPSTQPVVDDLFGNGGGNVEYVGPRGGVYHYSANGNKVYESHGGGRR